MSAVNGSVWFGGLSVQPQFRLSQVDPVSPDDAVAVRVGLHGPEKGLVGQGREWLGGKQRLAVVDLPYAVLEGDEQPLAGKRTNRVNPRISWVRLHLLQSRKLPVLLAFPHGSQLRLVLACPLPDELLGTPWKIAFDHLQGLDVEDTVVLRVDCMEVRDSMLTEVQLW